MCYLICIVCCTFLNRLFRGKMYSDYALMHLPCLVQFKFYDQAILGQAMTCSQCVSQAGCNQLVQVAYHLSGDQAIIHLFVYTNNRFYSNLNLTLPVRRYLVPTSFYREGGGVQPTPIDLEKGRLSTTFNFGSPLGLSIRGKKKLVEVMI